MKWNCPNHNDTKIETKFLWLPVTTEYPDAEYRWWCKATIKYRYTMYGRYWQPVSFID